MDKQKITIGIGAILVFVAYLIASNGKPIEKNCELLQVLRAGEARDVAGNVLQYTTVFCAKNLGYNVGQDLADFSHEKYICTNGWEINDYSDPPYLDCHVDLKHTYRFPEPR